MNKVFLFLIYFSALGMLSPAWGQRVGFGEAEKACAFADAFTKENADLSIVHLIAYDFDEQMCPEEMAWIKEMGVYTFNSKPFAQWAWDNLVFSKVYKQIQGQVPDCFFIFDSQITPLVPRPFVPMMPGSEWVVVLNRLLSPDRQTLDEDFPQVSADQAPILTHDNLYQVYKKPLGMLCLKETDKYRKPGDYAEAIYPAKVVADLTAIQTVMSGGGDTNALLALAAELEVDFSRKLVQEIVRWKQPPTQEEIWREEIDNAWNYRYREGEAKRGVWERMSILEKQFRAAHEAGELSDETYLELMYKIGLDLKEDPASTHFPYKPPPSAPEMSAD